jgi:asparagine synthase (glutamine-hydrolysing)
MESDHGAVLVQNGEIYNYRALRHGIRGYPWRTSGDSETILALHRAGRGGNPRAPGAVSGNLEGRVRKSPRAQASGNPAESHVGWVSKLDGIWGFSLWDPSSQELILCRDSLGVKPMLRTILPDGTLLFASEVKAFHGHPDFVARPDVDAMAVRLAYEYPFDRTTLFEGVSQVAQGTIETWSLDGEGRAVLTGIARYSKDIVDPQQGLDFSRQSGLLLDSLRDGIEDRMMSDVPLGVVLSGGLDSSLIASLARDVADATSYEAPACWTVAGSEDNPDLVSAKLVARHQDLEHHTTILPEDLFWNGLPNFVWHGEDLDVTVLFWQPLFEQMASEVKVGLCGQGADELHGGYERYGNLHDHSILVGSRLKLSGGIDTSQLPKGAGQPWADSDISPDQHFSSLESTLQFELDRGQLSNFQLRLADRHSMANGLEARVPFLSSQHRGISHRLPMSWRVSGPREKIALRAAASQSNLPSEIVTRPKLPAGTATTPSMVNEVVEEMKPHALEWAAEYGILAPMLMDQPDMALGVRIFHALHFTEGGSSRASKDLMTVLDDVGHWP